MNIKKSASGTKGNVGVTVIEFEHKDGPHACAREAVSQLAGVLRVRMLK